MKLGMIVLLIMGFGTLAKATEKTLDFKDVLHYQITLEPGIFGIFRDGNTLFTFPGEKAFYLKSTYKPEAKEKDLGFGTLHNPYDESDRVNFEPLEKGRRIRGAVRMGERLGFLDSVTRQFLVYNETRKVWQLPTDIILDVARPPRDAGGEGTRAEVNALRQKLTKELSRELSNPDLIAGVSDIPKSWKDKDGSQFVLWLRGTSSPLLTMKCDPSEFKNCVVQRACFVNGLPIKEYPEISGITRDPKSDTLWLLHKGQNQILKVSGRSCNSLKIEPQLRLPKSLTNAQTIFIDAKNNFWLGVREPEGATSGSVFIWEASRL
ncbi:MAG: hypothetical protein EOP10_04840 [Proteobacteria bacterium]|nr:MAG: hypothetical protein EOP10_04840 [Pseudomonadota bacterium]